MEKPMPVEELAWTGERLVTTCHRPLVYEHLHRYALAFGLAKGKRVLDIACGEGYGANLLADVGSKVIGVDLDAATIAHAKAKYRRRNLHFVRGSCTEIPCEDHSIDLVASFETIEHISAHDAFLSEIKRVLAPGGILVISSPHKAEYQKVSEAANPFHEAELDHDEFVQLITRTFKHNVAAKQRLVIGSWIAPDEPSAQVSTATFRGWFDGIDIESGVYRGLYSIAICSDQPLPAFNLGMFENLRDSADTWNLLDAYDTPAQEIQTLKHNAQTQSAVSIRLQESLEAGRQQLSAYETQLRQLTDDLTRKSEELSKTQGQLSVRVTQASQRTEQHKHSQMLLGKEIAHAKQYQNRLEREIEKDKQYRTSLERDIAILNNNLDAATKKDKDAREQLMLYSSQLRQQTNKMSTMHASVPVVADETSAELNGKASLIASPRQVPVEETMGMTVITWNTGDGSEGELYVSKDGEPEKRFVTGALGAKQVPWILAGSSYEFFLYAGTEHKRLLGKVRVSGVQIPLPESRGAFRGFLEPPLETFGATPHLGITGWVYSREAPISWIEAFLDDVPLGLLPYGEPRYDVPTDSRSPDSNECGFSKRFVLDEPLLRPQTLLVRVADERGNIQDFRTVTLGPPRSEPVGAISADDILSASKKALLSLAQISLDSFLASNSTVAIPSHETPELSIILVLYNRAELTLQCLYSILRSNIDSYEVVIVDNASTDETPFLLKRIRGARVVRNKTNRHFLRACNQAAKKATGKYILFLNNDAQLVAGSTFSALRTLNSSNDIGAVGGKIILPDGTLQEAGSIIWQDGSCLGYGRGDSPFAPPYMYKRDVDYCSGAFLLTHREPFLEDGGFDEDYSPAYYEETDYCVRLWEKGKRVVYDPNAIIFHYEFASTNSATSAIDLQIEHQKIFANKHNEWLQSQRAALPENILAARSHGRKGQRRILLLDDRVPHVTLGSGFPRSNRILAELVNLGHAVTFYPTNYPQEDWANVYQDIWSEVEVMLDHGWEKLREFLRKRSHCYDLIFISRPHNMASFNSILAETPGICAGAKIIYDAEALFSYRQIEQRRLEGKELSAIEQAQLIRDEISLAANCDCIVSVSDSESRAFSTYGLKHVYTLGHSIKIAPTPNDFEDRRDILFVGAIYSATSPNGDSMIWFSEEVLPLIQKNLGDDVKLIIAGVSCPEFQARLNNGSIQLLGKVDELAPLYDRARLFVAPTRFSAGLPLKVCEAAAYGLPTVATSLTGLQLGWSHERELLLADNPQAFADACTRLYEDGTLWNRLRGNMINRAREDFSPGAFSERLRQIIE